MHLQKTALVLEGGGMRGMFSAGVFEAFLAHQLTFPYITAVSAGACNILSYMSAQPLRTRQIIEHYVTDKRYFSVRNWIKSGSIFGFDFIFNELPKPELLTAAELLSLFRPEKVPQDNIVVPQLL